MVKGPIAKLARASLVALLATAGSGAQAGLFDQLATGLNSLAAGQKGGGAAAAGGTPSAGGMDLVCGRVLGKPYEGRFPPGETAEGLAGRYFNVTTDLSDRLRQGIDRTYDGAMPNIRLVIGDLKDAKAAKLAEAFVADPTLTNLAHVVAMAEAGDPYQPEDGPSERTEGRTLLALILLQYPDLARNPDDAVRILRENFTRDSGLSTALLARFHLYGDKLPRDMRAFSNYVAQASSKYPVALNDQSVFYALKHLPDWPQRQQYQDLIRMSGEMMASFNQSQGANVLADSLKPRALALMERGREIDDMTLEALGAGPSAAQLRARGERMRKEASGDANLIRVSVSTSEEYRREFERLLASSPKVSDQARQKLGEANQLRAQNLSEYYAMISQVALLFFNGNFQETQDIGSSLNQYFRNACQSTFRSVQFARESGVPEPTVRIDRGSEL